jgi:hypothetical protein
MLRRRRQSVVLALFALWLVCACASPAQAQERLPPTTQAADSAASNDRFHIVARSETYVQLFRRALLPGPNGALVASETALPIHEYLSVNARAVDSPWHTDSIDLEFAAWSRVWPTDTEFERPFDGDLQVASVRYRVGPAWVRLGRQQIAGGAARFARFDGLMAGAEHAGLFGEGYLGFGVLPRWNQRPGYHRLGSHEGDHSPYAEHELDRGSTWLAGARAGYAVARMGGSISFHEQRQAGELERRNLGVDLGGKPFDTASFGSSALVEFDSGRLADARLWLDVAPAPWIDVGAEFLRAEPALLLSRQSVLSVFTTDAYEELGARLSLRPQSWLRLETNGYLGIYDAARPGGRGEGVLRLAIDRAHLTVVRLAYTRVEVPANGYHSVRSSFSRKLSRRFACTLEAYGYFYDAPVAGYRASSFYSGTLSYRPAARLELLWGASVARSPYSALDAQTLLRAVIEIESPRLAAVR